MKSCENRVKSKRNDVMNGMRASLTTEDTSPGHKLETEAIPSSISHVEAHSDPSLCRTITQAVIISVNRSQTLNTP